MYWQSRIVFQCLDAFYPYFHWRCYRSLNCHQRSALFLVTRLSCTRPFESWNLHPHFWNGWASLCPELIPVALPLSPHPVLRCILGRAMWLWNCFTILVTRAHVKSGDADNSHHLFLAFPSSGMLALRKISITLVINLSLWQMQTLLKACQNNLLKCGNLLKSNRMENRTKSYKDFAISRF